MPISMGGHIGPTFNTIPEGGVQLERPAADGYYDYANGGVWVEGEPDIVPITRVNIQPATAHTMEYLVGMGGTANPRDVRVIHLNNGIYVYPQDEGRSADVFLFSGHRWIVKQSDNRPWHVFCRAIVVRELRPNEQNV